MLKKWIVLVMLLGWLGQAHATETVLQNAATANGNGKSISVADKGSVAFAVTISGTATVTFYGSADGGTTWTAMRDCVAIGSSSQSGAASSSGQYQCAVSGLTHVYAPITGCSACTVTVNASTSMASRGSSGTGVTLDTLLAGEDQANALFRVSGGAVRSVSIMSGVTSNTTSAVTTVFSGGKTPLAKVAGTGAVTATVKLFGAIDNNAANGTLICTITLSGTTKDVDGCDGEKSFTRDWPFYYAISSNVTGTGATLDLIVAVGASGNEAKAGFLNSAVVTGDTLVYTGAAILQCIMISENDAAPTAGTIIVYDNTAESGTQVFNWTLTTAVFTPIQICPQRIMTTGIYLGFTTTADVNVSVSYLPY